MDPAPIRILLVEDNKDFAKLLRVYLERFEKDRFEITWKENYADTMAELGRDKEYDIILMDYFLPGKNGLEITRELMEMKIDVPVVFLTVNKDFDLAIDVMKLGVDDYLVKEEISSPVLPKTILSVIEKHRLQRQLIEIEITEQRLTAIRETVEGIMEEFERPLHEMKDIAGRIRQALGDSSQLNYVKIIDDNVDRIANKMEKLKQLKSYKTVKYIKDIKMIDLS